MVYGKECECQDSGPSAEILISFLSSLIINLLTQRWAADNYCSFIFIILNVSYVVYREGERGASRVYTRKNGIELSMVYTYEGVFKVEVRAASFMINVDRFKSKSYLRNTIKKKYILCRHVH